MQWDALGGWGFFFVLTVGGMRDECRPSRAVSREENGVRDYA